MAAVMSHASAVVDFDELKRLSGRSTAPAVRRWASNNGIRIASTGLPWTTLDALNAHLGLRSEATTTLHPDEVL